MKQNPWSKWDPHGLSETWTWGGQNWGDPKHGGCWFNKVLTVASAPVHLIFDAFAVPMEGFAKGGNAAQGAVDNKRSIDSVYENSTDPSEIAAAAFQSQSRREGLVRQTADATADMAMTPGTSITGPVELPIATIPDTMARTSLVQTSRKLAAKNVNEVEAAISRLNAKGVYPMPGQRDLDTSHVLDLANKMETSWDDALSFAEHNRPGVIMNPDETETIIAGHHRHVAAEVVRGRGGNFTLRREELPGVTNDYKGDWSKIGRTKETK